MDTLERIKRLFADKIDLQEEAVQSEATLDSLGLDSLDKAEFLFSLEEEFHISIDEHAARSIATIRDLVNVVDGLTVKQQPVGSA